MVFYSGFTSRGRTRGGSASSRGRGGPRTRFSRSDDHEPNITSRPLGELLTSIENPELEQAAQNASLHASITDCRYVTSYNWQNARVPSIVVPGLSPSSNFLYVFQLT